jgi:hypothetical protein
MLHEDDHLSDEELLMAADGEFASRRAAEAKEHLASCWRCRARTSDLEATIADFVRAHSRNLDPQLPPIAGPRALLRAQLATRALTSRPRWWPRLAFAAAGLSIVVFALAFYEWTVPGPMTAEFAPGVAPKTSLTPGATLPVTASEVCSADFAQRVPAIPASIQREVFEVYGIANPRLDAYEVDYLITPQLGGATNIRNLWPEPYHVPVWNAHVKDELEDRLHQMVCSGELELATAQRDIAANWISAYKKYFRRDKPVIRRVPGAPEVRMVLARF